MKINIRYKRAIFALLMSFSISLLISFILVSINVGYNSIFLQAWLRNWGLAFLFAFIGAYFFPPVIQKIMLQINFENKKSGNLNSETIK